MKRGKLFEGFAMLEIHECIYCMHADAPTIDNKVTPSGQTIIYHCLTVQVNLCLLSK